MLIIKRLKEKMSKLYLNGTIGWLIMVVTFLSGFGYEVFGLSSMVFFLLLIVLLFFAIASFINLFLIVFTSDRGLGLSVYIFQLLSNIIFIIVVIMIYIFIFNTIGRL